jgi:hypothetical protein
VDNILHPCKAKLKGSIAPASHRFSQSRRDFAVTVPRAESSGFFAFCGIVALPVYNFHAQGLTVAAAVEGDRPFIARTDQEGTVPTSRIGLGFEGFVELFGELAIGKINAVPRTECHPSGNAIAKVNPFERVAAIVIFVRFDNNERLQLFWFKQEFEDGVALGFGFGEVAAAIANGHIEDGDFQSFAFDKSGFSRFCICHSVLAVTDFINLQKNLFKNFR